MNTTDKLTPQEQQGSKLTKQEICLYYGQEAKVVWFNRAYRNYKTEIREVDSYMIQLVNDYESIQLLLRPLSDISEEEAKEVWAALGFNQEEITREEIIEGCIGLSLYLSGIYVQEMTKRGFCLFPEWFEQGKAEMITRIFYTKIQ